MKKLTEGKSTTDDFTVANLAFSWYAPFLECTAKYTPYVLGVAYKVGEYSRWKNLVFREIENVVRKL